MTRQYFLLERLSAGLKSTLSAAGLSRPLALLKPAYDFYSFSVLPLLGRLIANDAASYRYLAESIRMHPDQQTLLGMLESAGFEDCDYHNLTGGIVAIHRGYKY